MEDSMYQRLVVAEKRLAEIDAELATEDCVKDIKHFKEISKCTCHKFFVTRHFSFE